MNSREGEMDPHQQTIKVRSRNILDLPYEILRQICTLLCFHCRHWEVRVEKPSYSSTRADDRGSLLALCLTSSKFRDIAQPILFHCLYFRSAEHTRLYVLLERFMRSLDDRVDLRRHVQCVDVWAVDLYCTCGAEGCERMDGPAKPHQTLEIESWSQKLGIDTPRQWRLDIYFEEALLQVFLMTRLPALQEIHLGIYSRWEFKLLNAWRKKRNFLAHVKHMETQWVHMEYRTCDEDHRNCNQPTVPSPAERALVEATPNLKLLSCSAGALEGFPSFRYLESLQLCMRGSWEGKLEKLLQGLPNLKKFAYLAGNEHGPSPAEIQAALVNHRDKLELLHIGIGRHIICTWAYFQDWDVPNDRPWAITSLRDFTKLKYLTLESDMIWKQRRHPENKYILPQILPESLEVLFVDDVDGFGGPVESLAQAVSTGRFQNLQRVLWWRGAPQEMQLKDRDSPEWLENDNWKAELPRQVREKILGCQSKKALAFPTSDGVWCDRLRIDPLYGIFRGSIHQEYDVSEFVPRF